MAAGNLKPPTTNLLSHDERRRIIHSVRKIGAITGSTPIVQDELHLLPAMEIILPALARRSSKREGVVMPSETSSLDTELGKKVEVQHRPPIAKLCLAPDLRNSISDITRLRLILTLTQPTAQSSSSTDTHEDDDDADSVLQQSLNILISTTPSDSEHAARRKKMVKLGQILGHSVPSAAAFPSAMPDRSRACDRTKRHSRRRSRSVPPPSAYPFAETKSGPTKLVRKPSVEQKPLPALTVDIISRPRPLIPMSGPCPPSKNSYAELRSRQSTVSSLSKASYGLKRRARETSSHNTSES
ncbi:hypothetical protein MIND_00951400 [Mycena indigotica]|uniref:Uncharacterized protein n=1 Tax=Mycena indigotica TaxID=2126181 RepID=A0A8H6W0K6_9AGAR|nr:uncharacterized protein MIND_00951400 [Mycena indigotica]KAF7297183.1 hypothetical protein MIND_00951400 [Mycena indigotica]